MYCKVQSVNPLLSLLPAIAASCSIPLKNFGVLSKVMYNVREEMYCGLDGSQFLNLFC